MKNGVSQMFENVFDAFVLVNYKKNSTRKNSTNRVHQTRNRCTRFLDVKCSPRVLAYVTISRDGVRADTIFIVNFIAHILKPCVQHAMNSEQSESVAESY